MSMFFEKKALAIADAKVYAMSLPSLGPDKTMSYVEHE